MKEQLKNDVDSQKELLHPYCIKFFHFVNDGLVVLDLSQGAGGQYIEANDIFCNMLGYTHEELIGLSPIDLSPKDLRQDMKQFIDRQKAGLERKVVKEVTFLTKNGSKVVTELSAHVVNLNGGLIGFGIHHDITNRKKFEQDLILGYEKELELRRELQNQNQQRIEFARGLVHEIKTSFTPILCNSEVLTKIVTDETALLLTQNIFRAASNLNRRVDEHFDLIRGEVGILNLEYNWISPSNLLNEVASEFKSRALLDKNLFQTDIAPNLPPLWADAGRLSQIVLNLLDNASKFTNEGTEIILRANCSNSKLCIQVEDNGPGISHSEREKIFQSYYRSKANPRKAGGLGLGLALCKYLAELHNGEMRVGDKKPKGSIFKLSIPYANSEDFG